jgi:hypothetical protein
MTPSLYFDNNKKYISTKEASSLTGYSQDYIGQLVRNKKILSRKVGRVWYVSEESILNYKDYLNEAGLVVESNQEPILLPSQKELKKSPKFKITLLSILGFLIIFCGVSASGMFFPNLLKNIYSFPNDFISAALIKSFTKTETSAINISGLATAYQNYVLPTSSINISGLTSAYKNYLSGGLPKNISSNSLASSLGNKNSKYVTKEIIYQPVSISDTALLSALEKLLTNPQIEAALRGPTGPVGPAGTSGSFATYTNYVAPNPAINYIGATFSSATNSSSNLLNANTANISSLTVSNNAIVQGPLSVSGDTNLGGNLNVAGNSAVTGNSIVTGNLNVIGTIIGNVAGVINPSFTLGSIPFQGASGLNEDNANLFYDAVNHRLGLGTVTPATTLDVTGTGNFSGALTANTLNSVVISGSSAPTLAITGTTTVSGSNTGDNATNSQYVNDYRSANFVADLNYQNPITLTTNGSSGAATFSSDTLNVPNYTLTGLGGQPLNTSLTSIGGLANASGSLINDGSGIFSYGTPWTGLGYITSSSLTPYALLAGATFSGAISATNLSGTNTGDQALTITGTTSPTLALSGSNTATFASGTGITLGQTGGTITITNSAPDQTVAFTGGTNVTIGGTYPNFSITDNSINSSVATLSSLSSIGTITTGVWHGTAIGNSYLANGAVANLSGTNTGDNAINSNYTTLANTIATANNWSATQTFSNATYSALFTGGNVGIGTTSPRANLHIYDSSANNSNPASVFIDKNQTRSSFQTWNYDDNTETTVIGANTYWDNSGNSQIYNTTGNSIGWQYFFGNHGDGYAIQRLTGTNAGSSPLYINNLGHVLLGGNTGSLTVPSDNNGGAVLQVTGGLTATGNVGIGTTSPNAKQENLATTEQLRLSYDSTHYTSFTVGSGGSLTLGGTTGILIATGFSGPLTGNVTGNVSGTSATVTGATQSAITSLGTLTGLTMGGDIAMGTHNISGGGTFTATTFSGALSGNATTTTTLATSRNLWGQSFNGSADVTGNLTSVGNITGSSAVTITAGGSNQNVTLTPSGIGYTLLNGNVGIGNTAPDQLLTVGSTTAGGNHDIYATLGSNICPNLTVAGNWTVAGGWSAGAGGLVETANTGPNTITPSGSGATPVAGVTYKIVITASAVSGGITYIYGGVSGTVITATTITDYITASTASKLIITGAANSSATITAITIQAQTASTGQLTAYGGIQTSSISALNGNSMITILPNGSLQVGPVLTGTTITSSGLSVHSLSMNGTAVGSIGGISYIPNYSLGLNNPITHTASIAAGTYGAANANVAMLPVYNDSGTGIANTDLQIMRTETSLGTTPGNQFLFQAGTSVTPGMFQITNTGNVGINTTTPGSKLDVTGNITGTPSLTGAWYGQGSSALTFTDNNTAGSGTATNFTANARSQPTLAATNSAVTTTNAYTSYITGAPIKGTNESITNTVAEYIGAGAVGAATNSYGLYVNTQTGATNNYAATFMGGNVGIGTTSPSQLLTVGNNNQFTVSSAGAVIINGGISSPQGINSEKFGLNASANSTSSVAIGNSALANYDYSVSIGKGSFVNSTNGVALGYIANAGAGSDGTAIGSLSSAAGLASTAVGYNSSAGGSLATALGGNASGADSVALGYASAASNAYSFALGYAANVQGAESIGLGGATSNGPNDTASIAIGYGASTTAANQLVIGGSVFGITNIYFGKGVYNASPLAVTINSTGGFGTNVSGANLQLAAGIGTGSSTSADILFQTSDATASGTTAQTLSTKMIVKDNGNVGIGTTSPSAKLDISDTTLAGSGSLAGSILNLAQTWHTTGTPTAIKLNVTNTGSAGTPLLMDLQTGGVSQFSIAANGVGTLHASSWSFTSDRSQKNNIIYMAEVTGFDALSVIGQLKPATFNYNAGPQNEAGFIAQDVQTVLPNLVTQDSNGLLSLKTDDLIPYTVAAIQELNLNIDGVAGTITPVAGSANETFVAAFFKNIENVLTGWLADAGNGIGNIFASSITVKNQLCINTTCITESQLQALLANLNSNSGGGNNSNSGSGGNVQKSAANTPVITLIGNTTINLTVGDSYTEQGATATENDNAVEVVITGTVDTTTAGTYTIDYDATDTAGNKATEVTRTVIVAAPTQTPDPVVDPTPASTPDSNASGL